LARERNSSKRRIVSLRTESRNWLIIAILAMFIAPLISWHIAKRQIEFPANVANRRNVWICALQALDTDCKRWLRWRRGNWGTWRGQGSRGTGGPGVPLEVGRTIAVSNQVQAGLQKEARPVLTERVDKTVRCAVSTVPRALAAPHQKVKRRSRIIVDSFRPGA